MRNVGENVIIKKKSKCQKNYRKIRKKMIMTWMLMWLNWSAVIINVMFQLLDIYIYIYIYIYIDVFCIANGMNY